MIYKLEATEIHPKTHFNKNERTDTYTLTTTDEYMLQIVFNQIIGLGECMSEICSLLEECKKVVVEKENVKIMVEKCEVSADVQNLVNCETDWNINGKTFRFIKTLTCNIDNLASAIFSVAGLRVKEYDMFKALASDACYTFHNVSVTKIKYGESENDDV